MNKQEILNEIEKTKEHLTNMEKMLGKCEYERRKPKAYEKYWYIDSSGLVNSTCFLDEDIVDAIKLKTYNYFPTKEQTEQEAEKILVRRMLEDIAKRLNRGEKIDWNNGNQNKYFICFNHWQDIIILEHGWKNKFCGVIYCLDKNFLDIAIQEIGKERLKAYLRGE